ncbi:MAG TPA: hypothetical protein VJB15_03630 [Rhodothermia bacterium]|nr:hypothetical protein [Rhodothermia bacterium]
MISRVHDDARKLAFYRRDLFRYLSRRVVASVQINGEKAWLLDYRAGEKAVPSRYETRQVLGAVPLRQLQVGVQDVEEILPKLTYEVLSLKGFPGFI